MATGKLVVGQVARIGRSSDPGGAVDYIVQPACTETVGYHLCVVHPKADTHNNFMAGTHFESPGQHAEVWVCATHGPEAA